VSHANRGGCGSSSRGCYCIVKHKLPKEIKNVFPFGQVTGNALTCPQVKAACLKRSNARTSGGQSAVTKAQAGKAPKGCKHAAGHRFRGWSLHYPWCTASALPPRAAVPAPADGTCRWASVQQLRPLGGPPPVWGLGGVGELVSLSSAWAARGAGSKRCTHRFSVLSRKMIIKSEHLAELKPGRALGRSRAKHAALWGTPAAGADTNVVSWWVQTVPAVLSPQSCHTPLPRIHCTWNGFQFSLHPIFHAFISSLS